MFQSFQLEQRKAFSVAGIRESATQELAAAEKLKEVNDMVKKILSNQSHLVNMRRLFQLGCVLGGRGALHTLLDERIGEAVHALCEDVARNENSIKENWENLVTQRRVLARVFPAVPVCAQYRVHVCASAAPHRPALTHTLRAAAAAHWTRHAAHVGVACDYSGKRGREELAADDEIDVNIDDPSVLQHPLCAFLSLAGADPHAILASAKEEFDRVWVSRHRECALVPFVAAAAALHVRTPWDLTPTHTQELDAFFASDSPLLTIFAEKMREEGKEEMLKDSFAEYVKSEVCGVLSRPHALRALLAALPTLRARAHALGTPCTHAAEAAIENVINDAENMPKVFASSLGRVLQRGGEDMWEKVKLILSLFRKLHSKDVFISYYESGLCHRLCRGGGAHEGGVLALIEEECGETFTRKLRSILREAETSREVFAEYARTHPTLPWAIEGMILPKADCPEFPIYQLNVGKELESVFRDLSSTYRKGRTLTPLWSLSKAEVLFQTKKGTWTLLCSAAQAVALLALNGGRTTLGTMCTRTGLGVHTGRETHSAGRQTLRSVLSSLGDLVHCSADSCEANVDYTNKKEVIVIDKAEEREDISSRTQQLVYDKEVVIECWIVKAIKKEKVLSKERLKEIVLSSIPFSTTDRDLEKAIDVMTTREYLEPKEELLHYVP